MPCRAALPPAAQFSALLRGVDEVLPLDARQRVSYGNRAAQHLLGYEVGQLRGSCGTWPWPSWPRMYAAAPVETGLIASLAHPGGNVTGTTTSAPELTGKMMEVMHDVLPSMTRVVFLNEPDYPGMTLYQRAAEHAAAAFGIKAEAMAVRSPADIDEAFRLLERQRPDALLVAMTGTVMGNYRRIIEFTATLRLPTIYSVSFPVTDGGLMSYSPNFAAMARRNAVMIDKILKGTRPADIPVEQPAEFELVVNLKTAKTLGLAVPSSILLRANEVIQ